MPVPGIVSWGRTSTEAEITSDPFTRCVLKAMGGAPPFQMIQTGDSPSRIWSGGHPSSGTSRKKRGTSKGSGDGGKWGSRIRGRSVIRSQRLRSARFRTREAKAASRRPVGTSSTRYSVRAIRSKRASRVSGGDRFVRMASARSRAEIQRITSWIQPPTAGLPKRRRRPSASFRLRQARRRSNDRRAAGTVVQGRRRIRRIWLFRRSWTRRSKPLRDLGKRGHPPAGHSTREKKVIGRGIGYNLSGPCRCPGAGEEGGVELLLVRGDITQVDAEGVVNPANSLGEMGGGV